METWSSTKSAEIPFQHLLNEVQAPHPLPHPAAEAKIPPASPNWSRASPERGTRARKPLIVRRGQKMKSSMEMSGMQPQPTPGASNATQLPAPKRAPQNYLQKAFPVEKGLGRRSVPGQSTLSTRGEQEKDAPHSAQLGRARHPLPGPRPVPKPRRDTATSSSRGKNPQKIPKVPKNLKNIGAERSPERGGLSTPRVDLGTGGESQNAQLRGRNRTQTTKNSSQFSAVV